MDIDNETGSVNESFGCRGTTSAKHVLWDLRREYRCCVVNRISSQTCSQLDELQAIQGQQPEAFVDFGGQRGEKFDYLKGRPGGERFPEIFHVSCFDPIFSEESKEKYKNGSRALNWEAKLSQGIKVLLNLSSNKRITNKGSQHLKVFSKIIAHDIFNRMKEKTGQKDSEIMLELLAFGIFQHTTADHKTLGKKQKKLQNRVQKSFAITRFCGTLMVKFSKASYMQKKKKIFIDKSCHDGTRFNEREIHEMISLAKKCLMAFRKGQSVCELEPSTYEENNLAAYFEAMRRLDDEFLQMKGKVTRTYGSSKKKTEKR
ncbi:hypothetical protein Btru_031183 [Bulinus truncatus]|nr:hypothetical protein Btru_031183 [Bulinus truncatus]